MTMYINDMLIMRKHIDKNVEVSSDFPCLWTMDLSFYGAIFQKKYLSYTLDLFIEIKDVIVEVACQARAGYTHHLTFMYFLKLCYLNNYTRLKLFEECKSDVLIELFDFKLISESCSIHLSSFILTYDSVKKR